MLFWYFVVRKYSQLMQRKIKLKDWKHDWWINAVCCYLKKLQWDLKLIHPLPFQPLVGVCRDPRESWTLCRSPDLQERLPHQLHALGRIRKFSCFKNLHWITRDVGLNVEFLWRWQIYGTKMYAILKLNKNTKSCTD